MIAQPVLSLPVSYDSYIRHGWNLVPIPPSTKGPTTKGWNRKENMLTSSAALPQGWGVGLAHAYSGTMALDIDHWDAAYAYLADRHIDLTTLFEAPDAVAIVSGVGGHGKLLYAMPFGMALPSKKLISTAADGTKFNYLDFRCGTKEGYTTQDVLPPSIHPTTLRPYQWAGRGRWESLPVIPTALLDLWQSLLNEEAERTIQTETNTDTNWDEVRSALFAINADISRGEWVQIGMALHSAGHQTGQPETAYQLFDEWSATGTKYKGPSDINNCWRSFKPDHGIRIGTLFHFANQAGWKRPMPDVTSLFGSVEASAPTVMQGELAAPPPDLDLSLLPPILAQRASEVADGIGCDPIVPTMAGLAAVCAAVDSRIRLQLMDGWEVPPVLWLMTIGDPADKKTPAARPMLSILKSLEAEDRPRYAAEVLKWEGLDSAYAASRKAYNEAARDPAHILTGQLDLASLPPVLPQPVKPVPLRLTVDDVTSQKLVRLASERPRGLLAHLDEMRGWASKLSSENSGENRSAWTKSYECDSYIMDRVGDGKTELNLSADHFAVSIYGNMQPQVFKQYAHALSTDGTLQRFIPCALRPNLSDRIGNPLPDSLTTNAAYEEMVRKIYALGVTKYHLSNEAYVAFRSFQEWYHATKKDDRLLNSGNAYMTALGKIEGTAGRLMLIWHLMTDPYTPEVSGKTAHNVITLIKSYIVPSFRYVYGEVGGMDTDSLEYWIMGHIAQYAGEVTHLTTRDIKRSARRQLEHIAHNDAKADMLVFDAMTYLEQHGWVAMVSSDKRSTQWAINPAIADAFRDYRQLVIAAKQRRYDEIHRLSGGKAPRRIAKGWTG